ncbi:hypothetical protein GQ42DRAFT_162408 [Ramicandelaber brevisporus]|nr:hypothetical protein GQ42DRAFT_162408 [Ramicandelaber brevisporus]
MRFSAIAVAAAAVATVSATNIYYANNGAATPFNYGGCIQAAKIIEVITAGENAAGDFRCQLGPPGPIGARKELYCTGSVEPAVACPRIRERCSSYVGIYSPAAACANY